MDAFIVDYLRSPIGNLAGSLAPVRPDDLASLVLREIVQRHPEFDPAAIDDIILGCANQAGEDNRNVARMAGLLAGLPATVPGITVNRLCASGMAAGIHAAHALHAGEGQVMLAGGVESMTRAPWVLSKSAAAFGRDAQLFDTTFGWRFINPALQQQYGTDAMGETAENLAEAHKISREDQDRFALWSQQKATAAAGRLSEEIVAVRIPQRKGDPVVVTRDEFLKPQTSLEGLSALKPAFRKGGSVTAGNSSGLNDGAAALLLANASGLKQHGLAPLARIVASGVSGTEPRIMGIGPVAASRLALSRAGLTLEEVDIIELNEAFAAQVLACTRSLGLDDTDDRINVNGGAIALGHPLGMSGARLLGTAARELKKRQKRYALCTMCIGVGQGFAVVLERC
jgi:3-oxoadipyl-CoA thiolase